MNVRRYKRATQQLMPRCPAARLKKNTPEKPEALHNRDEILQIISYTIFTTTNFTLMVDSVCKRYIIKYQCILKCTRQEMDSY